MAAVIEHLVEIDRRRLYLTQACTSLSAYCIERLGYSADEAIKRARVARVAARFPEVLADLASGELHLSGLFLLAHHLTDDNHAELLAAARGQSKRAIEALIAARFPKPDLPDRVCALPEQTAAPALLGSPPPAPAKPATPAANEPVAEGPARVEPRSARRVAVQFTASAELARKIDQARELMSHAIPGGELATLFERALDALIERETKRRLGANKPRKRRAPKPGSRHVPVDVARVVWERDGGQCTFVDANGRRCSARRFVTIEHRQAHAHGGPPTPENLCLLCMNHNLQAARELFGEAHIEASIAKRRKPRARKTSPHPTSTASARPDDSFIHAKLKSALCNLGFHEREARAALDELGRRNDLPVELESQLRAALELLSVRAEHARSGGRRSK